MTDIYICNQEHLMPDSEEYGEVNAWHETLFRLEVINPFYQALYKNNYEEAIECLKEGAHPLIGDSSYASEMIGDRIFYDKHLVEIILNNTTNKYALLEYIDLAIQVYTCALNRFEGRECIPIYRYQSDEKFKFNLIGLFTEEEIMKLCKKLVSYSVANLAGSLGYAVSLESLVV